MVEVQHAEKMGWQITLLYYLGKYYLGIYHGILKVVHGISYNSCLNFDAKSAHTRPSSSLLVV